MGSVTHRGQGKGLKLFTESSVTNKKMLVFSCYRRVGQKVCSHSQNPCSVHSMLIPQRPRLSHSLFLPSLLQTHFHQEKILTVTLHLNQPPRYTLHSKHQPQGAIPQLPGEAGSPENTNSLRGSSKVPSPPRRQTTAAQTRGDERYQSLLLPFHRQLHL